MNPPLACLLPAAALLVSCHPSAERELEAARHELREAQADLDEAGRQIETVTGQRDETARIATEATVRAALLQSELDQTKQVAALVGSLGEMSQDQMTQYADLAEKARRMEFAYNLVLIGVLEEEVTGTRHVPLRSEVNELDIDRLTQIRDEVEERFLERRAAKTVLSAH